MRDVWGSTSSIYYKVRNGFTEQAPGTGDWQEAARENKKAWLGLVQAALELQAL